MSIRNYGLIGKKLNHSFSPTYFQDKFRKENILNSSYSIYEINDVSDFEALKKLDILGLNVTIPYKTSIIPYLDYLHESAKAVGAVNTIEFDDGRLVGHNTDIYGFERSLLKFINGKNPKKALILGTGGASKAVSFVFNKLNISYRYVSRSSEFLGYEDLDRSIMEQADIIVNTTPLGMFPNVEDSPSVPYELMNEKHLVIDLIYNPEKTLFLKQAQQHSAQIQNGLEMLIYQAERSWEIWNNA